MSKKTNDTDWNNFTREDDDWKDPKAIKINVSTTFPIRARCKFCLKGPTHYYGGRSSQKWFSISNSKIFTQHYYKLIKRMANNYYLSESPRTFHTITPYAHTPKYKGYYPTLHKNRGVPAVNDYLEFLCCDCGRSTWGFHQKSTQGRPEITQSKARYSFYIKSEDWY